MDQALKGLLPYLYAHENLMIEQLHQFCTINSGSENLPGLALMSEALEAAFKPLADDIQHHSLPTLTTINMKGEPITQRCGDILFIRKRPELKRRILLSGHMDTVFAANNPFQHLTYINDNQLNGPGVADMKGGLLVILHALSAFEGMPAAQQLGWDVVINADEEIGSPASSGFFDAIAANYQAALVYEPAMDPEGTLAKNRRGSGKLTLIATGKSAHAGRAFYQGRNAICYLAEAVIDIHALNGLRDGVTINIGKIAGGEALNVVPDKAVAKLDVRISKPEDEQWVRTQLDAIIAKMQRTDYSITVHGSFDRPVKRVCESTQKLFSRIQKLGRLLDLTINWEDSGGCCDGNNLARHGLAVIDTLGVRGGNIHSANEYILLNSLVERSALSSLLLHDLAQGGLEELHI
ncbi:hydrolase [Legionella hackeliae]|uniref:Glutamate carboxypeptidase n=1 Tax=Legionella hackeliae TaxID=449 RepID=A0A0A8UUN4_LEGHA|nr:hydrolase [Legionella hackeliae]KTD13794.1 carboxypeptidase G2 [Legionella hackeliae]CEK10494.1 Glutamate carboxypeptidase [Legionella hackeliae]STX47232.1 carboxypeptidase G2 [Legionella hackeliae]